MPLTAQECLDIIHHIRSELQRYGQSDLDELIFRDFKVSQDPNHDLVMYLKLLIGAIKERSGYVYPKTINLLREYLTIEGSEQLKGIKVILSPEEAEL